MPVGRAIWCVSWLVSGINEKGAVSSILLIIPTCMLCRKRRNYAKRWASTYIDQKRQESSTVQVMDQTEIGPANQQSQVLLGTKPASTNYCKVNWFVSRKRTRTAYNSPFERWPPTQYLLINLWYQGQEGTFCWRWELDYRRGQDILLYPFPCIEACGGEWHHQSSWKLEDEGWPIRSIISGIYLPRLILTSTVFFRYLPYYPSWRAFRLV